MRNFILTITSMLFIHQVLLAQFGATVEIANVGSMQKSIHPIDLDNDGDTDLLTTDGATGETWSTTTYYDFWDKTITAQVFTICENVGTDSYVNHSLFDLGQAHLWALGDLSGDGLPDIVYAEAHSNSATGYSMYYRENLGSFNFGPETLVFYLPAEDASVGYNFWFNRIAIGDANSDGDNEILSMHNGTFGDNSTYSDSDNIYMIEYESGVFQTPQLLIILPIDGTGFIGNVYDLRVIDYNADGLNDLCCQMFSAPFYYIIVYMAIGPATYSNSSVQYPALECMSYDIGDVYGSGDLNLIGLKGTNGHLGIDDAVSPTYNYDSFIFNPNQNLAPGACAINVDADSELEFICTNTSGNLSIFMHDEIWSTYTNVDQLNEVNYDTGINYFISSIQHFDYDQDGDQDLAVMAEGHVFIIPVNLSIDNFATLQLNGFIDDNSNGIYDSGELPFNDFEADITNSTNILTQYFTTNHQIQLEITPGSYTLNVPDQHDYFNPGIYPGSFTFISASESLTIDIPFIIDGAQVSEASINLISPPGICDGANVTHSLFIENIGNIVANGEFTYEIDPVHSFVSSTPMPTSISGNTLIWDITNLNPMEDMSLFVMVTPASLADLGNLTTNVITVNLMDINGLPSFSQSETITNPITCSYDPNDITENNGYTDAGYVLDGSELEYSIRFQNTGNAPASNVRIENDLNDLLQRSTLQPVAWSHDFLLSIDENNLATFQFNDINLPDATSDESGSHGFVTYRILPVIGLDAGTEIPNTASIYFDFNPAIVTNTEMNTIYDCLDLEQASISATSICAGESIECTNDAVWIASLEWSFEDALVGQNDYIHTLDASGLLTMSVSNSLCTYSQNWELSAVNAEATFTANGNTLTANEASTYQWYLNGNPIQNATSQNYSITTTGNYSVAITDENGCEDVSEEMQVVYNVVDELVSSALLLYPNPVNDILNVQFNSIPQPNAVLSMVDVHGRVNWTINTNGTNSIQIDCSDIATGIYTILLDGRPTVRFMKK
ncbi:MAG: T9SS type A sorting domain-containing protein [Flavobacteriales bacterium]|nr:T9SS type A sorting domain-containing protein [Flavobacteriales bacterium]